MPHKDPVRVREYMRLYRDTHRQRKRDLDAKWRERNREAQRSRLRLYTRSKRGKEYARLYRERNRAKINERGRLYRQRNKEKINLLARFNASLRKKKNPGHEEESARNRSRSYYARHRKAIALKLKTRREVDREWAHSRDSRQYKANKDYYKHKEKIRRARLANASGAHSLEQWMAKVDYHGWRCVYCGRELRDSTLTKDHVIPIALGGTDFTANLVPACKPCNSSKGSKRAEVKRP